MLPAADTAEEVTLRFVPDGSFRAGLVIGAAIALALLAWVLVTARRRSGDRGSERAVESRFEGSTQGERTPLGSGPASPRRRSLEIGFLTGAMTVLVFAVAGVAAIAVPVCLGLWLISRRHRAALAWVAGCAEVLAGVAIAVHPGFQMGVLTGSGSYTAQALGALALAALAVSLLPAPDETARS